MASKLEFGPTSLAQLSAQIGNLGGLHVYQSLKFVDSRSELGHFRRLSTWGRAPSTLGLLQFTCQLLICFDEKPLDFWVLRCDRRLAADLFD